MRIEMADPQGQILEEIATKASTRDLIATTYAWCIRQRNEVDFKTINRAILNRWSPHALEYIKRKAWKMFE